MSSLICRLADRYGMEAKALRSYWQWRNYPPGHDGGGARADAEVLLNAAGRQLLAGLCGVEEDILARALPSWGQQDSKLSAERKGVPAAAWRTGGAVAGPVAFGCRLCAARRAGTAVRVVRYTPRWERVCVRHGRWLLDADADQPLEARTEPARPGRAFARGHAVRAPRPRCPAGRLVVHSNAQAPARLGGGLRHRSEDLREFHPQRRQGSRLYRQARQRLHPSSARAGQEPYGGVPAGRGGERGRASEGGVEEGRPDVDAEGVLDEDPDLLGADPGGDLDDRAPSAGVDDDFGV
jgi:hypothetical protein